VRDVQITRSPKMHVIYINIVVVNTFSDDVPYIKRLLSYALSLC